MLCTSGFMDDVTFCRTVPYGASGVATPWRGLMSMNALLVIRPPDMSADLYFTGILSYFVS